MELHRARVAQEAAAYKAEIELTVQRQRLRDEAEEKIAHSERVTEMLEKKEKSRECDLNTITSELE